MRCPWHRLRQEGKVGTVAPGCANWASLTPRQGRGRRKPSPQAALPLPQSFFWTINAPEWPHVTRVHRCDQLILFS